MFHKRKTKIIQTTDSFQENKTDRTNVLPTNVVICSLIILKKVTFLISNSF